MSYIPDIIDKVSALIRIKIEHFKLEAQGQIASIVSRIIAFFVVLVLVFSSMLFFGFALAFFLNSWLKSEFLGFLIVGGIFSLLLVLVAISIKSEKLSRFLEEVLLKQTEDKEAS